MLRFGRERADRFAASQAGSNWISTVENNVSGFPVYRWAASVAVEVMCPLCFGK